jgi:hypothetical protein
MFNLKDKVYILDSNNKIINENTPGEITETKETLSGKFYTITYISNSGVNLKIGNLTEDILISEDDVFIISIDALKEEYVAKYIIIKK